MNKNNNLVIPLSIIIAGFLIAGAIVFSNKSQKTNDTNPTTQVSPTKTEIKKVSSDDFLLGNPGAKIVVVEYSDLQCPYCQQFHTTMEKIMDEYGKDGKVAWVYRHYWAVRKTSDGQIFHPLGGKSAEAAECVAELGGKEKFWSFAQNIFADINTQQDKLTKLPDIAKSVGVDVDAFNKCLGSGKYTNKIQTSFDEGNKAGVSGTPSSFLVTKDGTYPVEGAVPYEEFKKIIESILNK